MLITENKQALNLHALISCHLQSLQHHQPYSQKGRTSTSCFSVMQDRLPIRADACKDFTEGYKGTDLISSVHETEAWYHQVVTQGKKLLWRPSDDHTELHQFKTAFNTLICKVVSGNTTGNPLHLHKVGCNLQGPNIPNLADRKLWTTALLEATLVRPLSWQMLYRELR